jgi:hypothetical protein
MTIIFAFSGLIFSLQATDKDWVQLQGKFLLNGSPKRVVIYIEGPPAGTDILVNSFVVKHAEKIAPSPPPVIEVGCLRKHLNFLLLVLHQNFC